MTAAAVIHRNGDAIDTATGEVLPVLASQPRAALALLRPIAQPAEVIAAQSEMREFVAQALTEKRDYGKIPGVDKPTLLKPGAERINAGFGVVAEFRIIEREIDHDRQVPWRKVKAKYDWSSGKKGRKIGEEVTEGVSLGLYRYVVECILRHRETGVVVGSCVGSCSTMESKYIDRPRDCENTALKMAEKRALVGAVLLTYGLSDEFTQDVEDMPREQFGGDGAEGASTASSEPEAKCPKCGGKMWDNRDGKTNPKAPDFKCRDKSCDGLYWPGQWPPAPAAPAAADEQIAAIREHVGQPWLTKQQSNGLEKRLGRGMDAKEAHEALEFCIAKEKEYAAQQQEQGGFDLAGEDAAEAADLNAHLNGEATTESDPRAAAMGRIRALLQHPACAKMAPTMTAQLADPTVTMDQLEMSEALLKETIEVHVRRETAKQKGGKKQAPEPHSMGAALPGEESENWFPDAEKKPDTRVRD